MPRSRPPISTTAIATRSSIEIRTPCGHCRVTDTDRTTASAPMRRSAVARSTRTRGSPSSMPERARMSAGSTVWAPLTSMSSTASHFENHTA